MFDTFKFCTLAIGKPGASRVSGGRRWGCASPSYQYHQIRTSQETSWAYALTMSCKRESRVSDQNISIRKVGCHRRISNSSTLGSLTGCNAEHPSSRDASSLGLVPGKSLNMCIYLLILFADFPSANLVYRLSWMWTTLIVVTIHGS